MPDTIPASFATFPLWPIVDGRCSCKRDTCTDIGKHPAYPYSKLEAGQQVPAKSGGGVGIATGARSGIWVLDLDGPEALAHLRTLGAVPKTYTVRTGRGLHLYFAWPAGGSVIRNDQGRKLGHPKIDVRGEGGYVVAAGSPHKSGGSYQIALDAPVAEAPAWLLDLVGLDATERRAAGAGAPTPVDVDSDEGERRIDLAVEYLQAEEPAVAGDDGSKAMWLVAQKLMRTYELPLDQSVALIQEYYNPRCVPPWTVQEIIHKCEDARDNGTWMCGIPSAAFPGNLLAAAQKPRKAPTASTRKVKDPKHAYTFTPGDRPNGTKRKDLTFGNMVADLTVHDSWLGVLQYDEFRHKIFAVNPPMKMDAEEGGLSKEDSRAICLWYEVMDRYTPMGMDMAYDAAVQAARRNTYHPVKEYLDSLPAHNGPSVLDTLAKKVFGSKDTNANEFLKKTLVAAVRRIRRPGCQVDTVLVLYGGQGVKKTTFVRELFGPEYVRSQMPDLASKDASQALGGFWAIELAELTRIVNAESSTVKEFLTRTYDDYRPPYGRSDIRFARQCVFIGTTNDQDFLSDATGNRRYLPIGVEGKIDVQYIIDNRDAIWAEANALEEADYPHWFEDDSAVDASREHYVREDAWHDAIKEYLKGRAETTNADVYKDVVMNGSVTDLTKYDRKVQMRIAESLKRLGCKPVNKNCRRYWEVGDDLQKETPSATELQKRSSFNRLHKSIS